MTGHIAVAPHELEGAAATLRGVRSELSGTTAMGSGSLSVGEVGVAELSGAVAEFCQRAFSVASLMAAAVDAAGQSTQRAAAEYVRVDGAVMPAGPREP